MTTAKKTTSKKRLSQSTIKASTGRKAKPKVKIGDTLWKVSRTGTSIFNRFSCKFTIDSVEILEIVKTFTSCSSGRVSSSTDYIIKRGAYFEDGEPYVVTVTPGVNAFLDKEDATTQMKKEKEDFAKEHRKVHKFCNTNICEFDRLMRMLTPESKSSWHEKSCLINSKTGMAMDMENGYQFNYKELRDGKTK